MASVNIQNIDSLDGAGCNKGCSRGTRCAGSRARWTSARQYSARTARRAHSARRHTRTHSRSHRRAKNGCADAIHGAVNKNGCADAIHGAVNSACAAAGCAPHAAVPLRVSHAARYPTRHGSPCRIASHLACHPMKHCIPLSMVSHAARYPTQHGIPRGTVAHDRTHARARARDGIPRRTAVLACRHRR